MNIAEILKVHLNSRLSQNFEVIEISLFPSPHSPFAGRGAGMVVWETPVLDCWSEFPLLLVLAETIFYFSFYSTSQREALKS